MKLAAITSWIAIICLTVVICMGHDGVLIDTMAGINLAALGGIGVYEVIKKKGV